MRHHLHRLLLFAVIAVNVDPFSSAGAVELKTLDADHRCVAGKMGGIPGQGGRGEQDVTTVVGGQMMVKHKGTPKGSFRAMVRTTNQLDYELVADYEEKSKGQCKEAITGLVEKTEGCGLAEEWHDGKCDEEGKCTGGGFRVSCGLSEVQQVQNGNVPTGYSVTDVTVWSSEGTPCLAVSAKFANTEKNFCYLVESKVPNIHLKGTKTVMGFMGWTTTTSTTEATTEGTTAVKTTTEKTTSTETNTATEVGSTTATSGSTTTAETTTTAKGPTTAEPTGTADGSTTGPPTKDPAGFRLEWYIWVIAILVVVVLVGLGASAYFWHRHHRRANRQKDEEELLGSDHWQSGSGECDGKSAEGKTKKAAEKEDNKDDGHEQVKSGSSHYFTQSAEKSEVSGEKQEETTKATQRVSIIVPDSSSLSEAPEKKSTTTDGAEKSKESGEKKEEDAKKEGTVQDNGYEVMGSTLLGAAGVGIPPTETATVSELPAKKETTNDGYEKLDDVV